MSTKRLSMRKIKEVLRLKCSTFAKQKLLKVQHLAA